VYTNTDEVRPLYTNTDEVPSLYIRIRTRCRLLTQLGDFHHAFRVICIRFRQPRVLYCPSHHMPLQTILRYIAHSHDSSLIVNAALQGC